MSLSTEKPSISLHPEKPVLYSFFRSSCAWRVRIALQIAGIEVEQIAVNLAENGQNSTEFGNTNPLRQVPALVIHGVRISQSMAIMEYLNDISGGKLMPVDPKLKAQVRMISEIINAGIQPIQNSSVLLKYSSSLEERAAWAKHWISKGFNALEKLLSETAGQMCVGDSVTIADCCLVPQVSNAVRFEVDMSLYPNICRINNNLVNRPEFKASTPENQPDFVEITTVMK
ncbi:maleylacetoacetate isomerase isoform X1 [Eurytemora carolleeae]|uniref:maleylacetoacetate isomerase isoform X1 n=1 Tax=Eurytemora carolleeae TaxID=1294199 RepID=UPI000C79452F|nr:maleylacetoacetate isomerase isoform X1 [Eurytemora carolleeae]|eukprot:XP_023320323.1 maleylacetoacetate isomerase-like isoform X1 [Eurytemora affinis]